MATLCNICRTVNFAEPSLSPHKQFTAEHHVNGKALWKAAADGCLFCELLCSTFKSRRQADIEGITSQLSIYLWSRGGFNAAVLFQLARHVYIQPDHVPSCVADLGSYMLAGDKESKTFPGRRVTANAESPACLDLVKSWLRNCLTNSSDVDHSTCQPVEDAPLPTRVIDVGPSDGSQTPRLHRGEGSLGQWISLSHRWNNEASLTTTTRNLTEHLREIPWSSLPKTFRDAIRLTRFLGFRYLWIDSLCILQDSSTDWAKESKNMCNIYMLSVLTISANHPESAKRGLFAERTNTLLPSAMRLQSSTPPIQDIGIEHSKDSNGCREPVWIHKVLPSFSHFSDPRSQIDTLTSRGWILQESLLSPRVILWGSEQMVWQCAYEYHESLDARLHLNGIHATQHMSYKFSIRTLFAFHNTEATRLNLAELHLNWRGALNDYCMRNLTYRDDVFPAISGLATRMKQITGDEYLAGIWKSDLARGLLWHSADGLGSPPTSKESSKYLAPTWSWASQWGSRITFIAHQHLEARLDQYIEFVKDEIAPRTADPLGQISSATLVLRAPVMRGPVENALESVQGPNAAFEKRVLTTYMDCDVFSESIAETDLYCLAVGTFHGAYQSKTIHGLVLKRLTDSEESYQRIGVWWGGGELADLYGTFNDQEITLV
ncbi:HET-domain-containing protein [Aulographum hederae CBS 113979]|uniref:HET-domain-containing protein n=1 Tax=Aulographum hederae CBS 113979 TaxID=1176131 RepID=A0A6G1GRH1_9PEZI|nr:HET-domain-containing protein [Aulographum hederae CBS 113979]